MVSWPIDVVYFDPENLLCCIHRQAPNQLCFDPLIQIGTKCTGIQVRNLPFRGGYCVHVAQDSRPFALLLPFCFIFLFAINFFCWNYYSCSTLRTSSRWLTNSRQSWQWIASTTEETEREKARVCNSRNVPHCYNLRMRPPRKSMSDSRHFTQANTFIAQSAQSWIASHA